LETAIVLERFRSPRIAVLVAVIFSFLLVPPAMWAQDDDDDDDGGGTNNNNNNYGGNYQNAGVVVDAEGVLRLNRVRDPGGLQTRRMVQAAVAALNPALAQPSKLRKVSLTRLAKAAARMVEEGQPLPDEMRYLAGLLRIRYVFFYPETGDIVVAGPAEGFAEDLVGRVRGATTGRPVLQLNDLVVALRAYPPGGGKMKLIGVSIDPTQEGLERLRQTVANLGRGIYPGDDVRVASILREALGKQTVRVEGVSPRTHFAQVLVEADYRMKLIGIGLEQPSASIPSFVSRANPRSVARNALQRWYFVPQYKCVRESADGFAMQLEGRSVQLVGQGELVREGGTRLQSGTESRASREFCDAFTAQYAKLAAAEPVYAELRNMIDMAVAAAFIQQQDYYQQANWRLGMFADEATFPVETHVTPQYVESAVNVVWKGNVLMTPIGGGVHLEPLQALKSENVMADDEGKVTASYKTVSLKDLPAAQWWWD
jgi:hypothetical protein